MNNRILKTIRYFRYASGSILYWLDIIIFIIISIDILRIYIANIPYFDTILHLNYIIEFYNIKSFLIFVFFLVTPLLFSGGINYLLFQMESPYFDKLARFTSRRKNLILLFHIIISFYLSIHISSIKTIENLSGVCNGYPCFESIISLSGFTFAQILVALFVFFALPSFWPLFQITTDKTHRDQINRSFKFWRKIADISGDLHPIQGDEIIYVNNASMAPSLLEVVNNSRSIYSKYQLKVPTSINAKDFLIQESLDCKTIIRDEIINKNESENNHKIEFFTGTSRALEIGISRIKDLDYIILSPYEHPTQANVIEWYCKIKGINSTFLEINDENIYLNSWKNQKENLLEQLRAKIITLNEAIRKIAVIISEVSYKTGLHLKIKDLIKDIKSIDDRIIIIIDGSQAVGNIKKPLSLFIDELDFDDFYYFSAHKWLLSPNTCGVLISHKNNQQQNQTIPYDMFGIDLPNSTIDPNTIFGLRAALNLLYDQNYIIDFQNLSNNLKSLFIEIIENQDPLKMKIIKTGDPSLDDGLFIALKPNSGYRWKINYKEFWTEMQIRGIDITVIKPNNRNDDTIEYILRISFPHFIIPKSLKNLIKHLNDLIEHF